MTRKIKYKEPNQALAKMAAPSIDGGNRASVGMDKFMGEYFYLSLEKLIPYKNQARSSFNEEELSQLAETIKIHGVRQPLSVIKSLEFEGKYEVISGERRLRASKIAGLIKVPCIVLDSSSQVEEIALIENVQRVDLHPIELAHGLKTLIDGYGWGGQTEIERKIGIPQARVSEALKLLNLSKEIQDLCVSENYTGRDNLLSLLKMETDKQRIEKILGVKENKKQKTVSSILRIKLEDNDFKVQKNSIKKLSLDQKKNLIFCLKEIVSELEL